ncbi:MAG TPA: signal peptidase I [Acidimicrobiales bacterium]|nr:signal peptidase I [Acidimicrobiales bacterium]
MDSEPSEVVDPWQNVIPPVGTPAGGVWPHLDAAVSSPGPAPAEEDAKPSEAPPAHHRRWRWVVEWAMVLVIALAVALVVRAYVIQTFFIPSQSMEPTLMVGDRILVDKLSYHLHAVHRGDIVVFSRPPGEPASSDIQDLVKRVVGLPRETIWSINGNVYVQGPDTHNQVLLVPEPVPGTQLGPPIKRTYIPANDFFVLGDNRTDSDDSRYFGFVPRSDIVGRVVMRIWPVSNIRFF